MQTPKSLSVRIALPVLLSTIVATVGWAQQRSYQTHVRSMLHETIFNTGEIGRGYDKGQNGMLSGQSSMEWPPNSRIVLDRTEYAGQHNSYGGGFWIAGTASGSRQYMYCGAVSENTGRSTQVEGIYSIPLALERRENYPLLPNGNLNPAYNPDEAEEIIVSKWRTVALNTTVTRTSRAWSYPGYDSFIIFEYDIQNTGPDTLKDVFVAFPYALGPSMFGYERRYNRWGEGDYRQGDQFARWDLRRWMGYNHDRYGKPDSTYFSVWSTPGNRGGLNSPQAAGFVTLYYDYDHIADSGKTSIIVSSTDAKVIWDRNKKVKQPYLNRYENGNVDGATKQQAWLDPAQARKTGPYNSSVDSTTIGAMFPSPDGSRHYWLGRGRPSFTLGWSQPVFHGYGFAPYILPPGHTMRFALAEVVGYGPGRASDSVYQDVGGVSVTNDPNPGLHPVPSWYAKISYPNVGTGGMGSDYLQTHPTPWYVQDTNVISIRDVADRAIQMYTGVLAKHDTVQYEPLDSTRVRMKQRNGAGYYNTVPVPVPSPVISVENTRAAVNKITWGTQVESFTTPRLHAPLREYVAMRSTSALGPWTVIDRIRKRDLRYFRDSVYVVLDTASNIGDVIHYAVVSVDSLGGKSGMTTISVHETQSPAVPKLGKVYVVPNPLVVTNGKGGFSEAGGEVTDKLQFYGLTENCTIRIFSYSGQLIQTMEHRGNRFGHPWYQITRNSQLLASGVYFFVVQDVSGAVARGKFVVIH